MDSLAAYHPAIVHVPITLVVTGALFELVGRATDVVWWRRAAFAMLVVGVLGAAAAVLSGNAAENPAEHQQGVPHEPLHDHERAATWTLWIGVAAVVTRALSGSAGAWRSTLSGMALLLHLAAALLVTMTAYRGGILVYEHGAGVRLHRQLLKSGPPPAKMNETAKRE